MLEQPQCWYPRPIDAKSIAVLQPATERDLRWRRVSSLQRDNAWANWRWFRQEVNSHELWERRSHSGFWIRWWLEQDKDQPEGVEASRALNKVLPNLQVQEPQDPALPQDLEVRFPWLPHEFQKVAQLLRPLANSHKRKALCMSIQTPIEMQLNFHLEEQP